MVDFWEALFALPKDPNDLLTMIWTWQVTPLQQTLTCVSLLAPLNAFCIQLATPAVTAKS